MINRRKLLIWASPVVATVSLPVHAVCSASTIVGTWVTSGALLESNNSGAFFRSITLNADNSFVVTESAITFVNGTVVRQSWSQQGNTLFLRFDYVESKSSSSSGVARNGEISVNNINGVNIVSDVVDSDGGQVNITGSGEYLIVSNILSENCTQIIGPNDAVYSMN